MNNKEVIKALYDISTDLIINYDNIESELTNRERKEFQKKPEDKAKLLRFVYKC